MTGTQLWIPRRYSRPRRPAIKETWTVNWVPSRDMETPAQRTGKCVREVSENGLLSRAVHEGTPYRGPRAPSINETQLSVHVSINEKPLVERARDNDLRTAFVVVAKELAQHPVIVGAEGRDLLARFRGRPRKLCPRRFDHGLEFALAAR